MARQKDRKHLERVAQLGCCICAMKPVQVHHLLRVPERGAGRKADDRHVIPVCFRHHQGIHLDGNETRYLEQHGIDGPALAKELYEAEDFAAMEMAVMGAWLGGL